MKYIVGKKINNELLCSFSKLLWLLSASSGGAPLVFSFDCANRLGRASGWGFNALQTRVDGNGRYFACSHAQPTR